MSCLIEVNDIRRSFRRRERREGLGGALKDLFNRRYTEKLAVDGISFRVEEGEMIGLLGPNGAGKTTTLKMLSGLLHPTSGDARVLGFVPWERRPEYLRQISLVMGQKNQLWWDLPAIESFRINKEIYEIPERRFREVLADLASLLGLEDLLNVQVRRLSLGERMKMELVGALLHSPRVLFLDEPTIGLDVITQKRLHEFLREHNKMNGTTMILTSHYMGDVKALAERLLIINHGRLIYDGAIDRIARDLAGYRLLRATFAEAVDSVALSRLGRLVNNGGLVATLKVPFGEATRVAAALLTSFPVQDFTIEEVPLEEVLSQMFTGAEEPISADRVSRP